MCELASKKKIRVLRKYLKIKIQENNIRYQDHTQERNHIYDLLKRVISNGESHSALIIGPRGAGKTTLLNSVLYHLADELDLENDAIIVNLNGLLHQDDKIALKSITSQMKLENAVGDRVFGTFAENLSFLLSCLQSGIDRQCKSMIFILEEFDLFCHIGKTQTLLYNLFDITHSKQAPMCVLGLTNCLDAVEMLEKRVKSRFSFRQIFIFPNENTNPDCGRAVSALESYQQRLIELLSMPLTIARKMAALGETPKKSGGRKKLIEELMEIDEPDQTIQYAVPSVILEKCKTNIQEFKELDLEFIEAWNAHVKGLSEDQRVVDALEKLCYYTVNEQIFRNILFQTISLLRPTKPYIDAVELSIIVDNTVAPEHRVKLLQSLSILELSLVIAMKHGMEIFDGQPMNFEMVLHRYTKFANANSSTQSVPRPVILKAFEHLQALEIIMPVRATDSIYSGADTTTSRVQKEYKLYTLAVPDHDIKEAVKNFKALPTEINHWFNNSVI